MEKPTIKVIAIKSLIMGKHISASTFQGKQNKASPLSHSPWYLRDQCRGERDPEQKQLLPSESNKNHSLPRLEWNFKKLI